MSALVDMLSADGRQLASLLHAKTQVRASDADRPDLVAYDRDGSIGVSARSDRNRCGTGVIGKDGWHELVGV